MVIDDCSTDKTTEIINEFQKEDKRIILINHEMNEGKIKTRSDGVKIAKGTYITVIDGDDSFAHENILKNSLYAAKNGNLDIIEFQEGYFKKKKYRGIANLYPFSNLTNIVYQPELKTKFFVISNNDKIRAVQSRSVCAKIIKNEVFKEALKFIGTKYTHDYIIDYEDTIMFIGILQVAKSYYYMKELGYYYSKDKFKGKFPKLKNKICKPNNGYIKDMGHIKLLNFLLEKNKKNEFGEQLIYHELISIDHYLSLVKHTNHHFNYVYEVFNALIESSYLSDLQKQRLIQIKTRIENKERSLK